MGRNQTDVKKKGWKVFSRFSRVFMALLVATTMLSQTVFAKDFGESSSTPEHGCSSSESSSSSNDSCVCPNRPNCDELTCLKECTYCFTGEASSSSSSESSSSSSSQSEVESSQPESSESSASEEQPSSSSSSPPSSTSTTSSSSSSSTSPPTSGSSVSSSSSGSESGSSSSSSIPSSSLPSSSSSSVASSSGSSSLITSSSSMSSSISSSSSSSGSGGSGSSDEGGNDSGSSSDKIEDVETPQYSAGRSSSKSSVSFYSSEDVVWLSRAIYGTADEVGFGAKLKIGEVILNRVAAEDFPKSVKDVVLQKDESDNYEFDMYATVHSNGRVEYHAPDQSSIKAAERLLRSGYIRVMPKEVVYYNEEVCGCGAMPTWWDGVRQYTTDEIFHFGSK